MKQWLCDSVRRWFRLNAPAVLIPVFWNEDDRQAIRLERQRQDIANGAQAMVLRVRSIFALFPHDTTRFPEERQRADVLLAQDSYHWDELFELEMLAIRLAPDEDLVAIVPRLPADAPGATQAQASQARRISAMTSTRAGQRAYYRILSREKARDSLRLHLLMLTLLIIALLCTLQCTPVPTVHAMAFSGTFGVLGAFFSILQRLQNISTQSGGTNDADTTALMNGSWGLYLSLASGLLSGMLMLCVFAAGLGAQLFRDAFIPVIGVGAAGCVPKGWQGFQVYLVNGADYGKMAIWAFASGFSERFIPDLLTKVTGSGDTTAVPAKPPG
jgi:hypothetical protein